MIWCAVTILTMTERRCLILFARSPEPGQVKTRLAACLGEDRALALYTRMLQRQIGLVNSIPQVTRQLCLAGDAELPVIKAFDGTVLPQCEGDLGKRMAHALATALQAHDVAVLIGCDSPGLDKNAIEAAFAALAAGHDAVFAPALDGGYVLVGLRHMQQTLFEDMDWGTASVMDQTRRCMRQLALQWQELAEQPDIDTPEDLTRHADLVAAVYGVMDKDW